MLLPSAAPAVRRCLGMLAVALVASLTGFVPADAAEPVGGPLLGARGVVVKRTAGMPRLPKVRAATWLVADATSGSVLAARGAHVRRPPASTLKALTALVVARNVAPREVHVATVADVDVVGSRVGMVPGAPYTGHQLYQALFLRSGNDAANALARANGGVRTTVTQMNAFAASLGARDTHAVNPTGLDERGQVSSAYDLALLGREVLRNPMLLRYAGTVRSTFPGKVVPRRKRARFEIYTTQRFVINYVGAVGIKNGWTTKARDTVIAAATRNGRTVLVTMMGGKDSTWREASALADWAFRVAPEAAEVGSLVATAPPPRPPRSRTRRPRRPPSPPRSRTRRPRRP
ncbi:MAG: D-alanyl-D-alanine carboxypeptidase, partial [Actinomycetota bacterium]|nr:D-alanyl-D-alanine carboxypeptidase [Actinomycetota bacterium]